MNTTINEPESPTAKRDDINKQDDLDQIDGDVEDYYLLMDPEWEPTDDTPTPPLDAVVGLWPIDDEGKIGPLRGNPEYVPRNENSPTDPTDVLLRLSKRGEAEVQQLQLNLREARFDVAVDGDGSAVVTQSPDQVQCVIVTTSEPHRRRVTSPGWQQMDLMDLVVLLPDNVDALLNPGGPAPVRLTGGFLRETAMMGDDEIAEAYETFKTDDDVVVVQWTVDEPDDRAQDN